MGWNGWKSHIDPGARKKRQVTDALPKLARPVDAREGAFGLSPPYKELSEIADQIVRGKVKVASLNVCEPRGRLRDGKPWGGEQYLLESRMGLFPGVKVPLLVEHDLGDGLTVHFVFDGNGGGKAGSAKLVDGVPFLSLDEKRRITADVALESVTELIEQGVGTSFRRCEMRFLFTAAKRAAPGKPPRGREYNRRSPPIPITIINPSWCLEGEANGHDLARFKVELAGSVVDIVDQLDLPLLATVGDGAVLLTGIVNERRTIKHPLTNEKCVVFVFDTWMTKPEYIELTADRRGRSRVTDSKDAETAIAEGFDMSVRVGDPYWTFAGIGPRIVCLADSRLADRVPPRGKRVTVVADVFGRIAPDDGSDGWYSVYVQSDAERNKRARDEAAEFGLVREPPDEWRGEAGFGAFKGNPPRPFFIDPEELRWSDGWKDGER